MKKVSIVVPIYNTEHFLEECINSLIHQTYKCIEIILINDGSTDDSEKICEKFKKIDNRIVYYKQKNSGVSVARNKGIELASGDYILFVDSDDTIDLTAIENMTQLVNEKKLVGIKIEDYQYKSQYTKEEFIEDIMNNKLLGTSCGYLYQKEYLKNILFDTNTYFLEDTLFVIEYLKNIDEIIFVENSKYRYTKNNTSVTNKKNIKTIEKNILNFSYSLNNIEKVVIKDNYNLNIKELVENKKLKLIESELIKCQNKKDIKMFCNSKIIRNEIPVTNSNNFILKMVKVLITNKKILLCYYYVLVRKIVMYIKRR